MTNIITIYNNKEFFEYPNLEKLLKDVRKDPSKEITYKPEILTPRVISKNIFIRAIKWVVIKIKQLWHSICLMCSKSYTTSYRDAASRIQDAKVNHIRAQNDAEELIKMQKREQEAEARNTRIAELTKLIVEHPQKLQELEAQRDAAEAHHRQLLEEKEQYGDLDTKKEELKAQNDMITLQIVQLQNKEKQAPAEASLFNSMKKLSSNVINYIDPASETNLMQKLAEIQIEMQKIVLLKDNLIDSQKHIDAILKQIEELNQTNQTYVDELDTLKSAEPTIAQEQETNRDKLTRLINEGTETDKISTLFAALFNNFDNAEDNIKEIVREDKNNIMVSLKKPWRIWSPSKEAVDGVIIKIHKQIMFTLSKNCIQVTSDDTKGLQSFLKMPWPMGENSANMLEFEIKKNIKDIANVYMTVSVGYINRTINETYDYFHQLWGNECVPIPDDFKGTYPSELQKNGLLKELTATHKASRSLS